MSELEIYKGMVNKMKDDEIKEILDYLQDKDNYIEELGVAYKRIHINNGDLNLLLDYITNLQKENERLKKECKQWKENHKAVCIQRDNILDNIVKDTEETIDYKSRVEKAVEIINKYELIVGYYDYADEDGYWDTDSNNNLQEELKDTLNGRSDE